MNTATITPHRAIELHLPSLDRHGKAIDRRPWVDLAAETMCKAFGGVYEEVVTGYWHGEAPLCMREETSRLVSYADQEQLTLGLPKVQEIATRFMEETDQEVVMIAVDGQPQLIRHRCSSGFPGGRLSGESTPQGLVEGLGRDPERLGAAGVGDHGRAGQPLDQGTGHVGIDRRHQAEPER